MKTKQSTIENIAYIALMTAINVVFVIIDMFLGGLSLFLLFVLPLASAFTLLFCKGKFFLIYLLATILLTGLLDFQLTIFYIIPSLISGAIFGVCLKTNIPITYTLILAIIAQVVFSLIALPLINFFYHVDMVQTVAQIFSLSMDTAITVLPLILTVLGFIQITLTYLILESEVRKVGFVINIAVNVYHYIYGIIGLSLIIFIFTFFYLPISFAFLPFTFFIAFQLLFNQFKNRNYWIILIIMILNIFVFAFISGSVSVITAPIYIFIFPLSFAIYELIYYQLHKNQNNITIS